jgi:5-methylcytosine-specific restriction protein A
MNQCSSDVDIQFKLNKYFNFNFDIVPIERFNTIFIGYRPNLSKNEEGFSILRTSTLVKTFSILVPDNFNMNLVTNFSKSFIHDEYLKIRQSALDEGCKITLYVNNIDIDYLDPTSRWKSFYILTEFSNFNDGGLFIQNWEHKVFQSIVFSTYLLLKQILSNELLPYFVTENFEGEENNVLCKSHERNRKNRQSCIDFYGYSCYCCGDLLSDIYGSIGENVIEVHHVTPVSEIGIIRVNPIADLVPVCSNCHTMLHRENPVMLPGELRNIIKSNRDAKL